MHKPSHIERAFTIVSLILYGGAILPLFRSVRTGESTNTEGDILSQIVYLSIYVITAYYVSAHAKALRTAIIENKGLLIIFSLTIMSVSWSDDPAITARRVFALLGTSLFGYYLAIRYSLQEILHIINRSLFISALLSVLVAIAIPSMGLMSATQEGGFHEGAWKGVYIHKNTLGRLMVINTLTSFILYSITKQKKYWIEIALAFFLIIMSRSSSATVIVVFVVAFSYLLKTFRLQGPSLILLLLILLTVSIYSGIYLVSNYEFLFELLGKDPTLTGRTALWEQVLIFIGKRPLIGHGFGGFWLGGHSESAKIAQDLNWDIPNAHSGFLDIMLDLGYIGIVSFMGLYLAKLFSFMKSYNLYKEKIYEWGVIYMLLFLIYNFVESNMLRQNNFLWVILVTTLSSYDILRINSRKTLFKSHKSRRSQAKKYVQPVPINN